MLAAELPPLTVWSVDPGDLRTAMHQAAFPGEDISDRPEPASVVPAFLELIDSDRPSGRYRAAELVDDRGAGMTALTADAPAARLPELHPLSFTLPAQLEAPSPPESRGMTRDAVRMMVATRSDGSIVHSHFSELPRFLDEGDLVVINTSGTLAAELDGTAPDGSAVEVHLSTHLPAGLWTVEVRRGGQAHLGARRPARPFACPAGAASSSWRPTPPAPAGSACGCGSARSRRPSACTASWPATGGPSATATSRAATPSRPTRTSTPPSPARPRCPAPAGPSLPSCSRAWWPRASAWRRCCCTPAWRRWRPTSPPTPSTSACRSSTAHRINDARRTGGRVVAVGTTVVRALESVVDEHGHVHPSEGWTETVVSPERPVRSIDGFLTGWHEPEASHLAMLEAIAGRPLLEASYAAALEEGYLWHEFGDVHLILP